MKKQILIIAIIFLVLNNSCKKTGNGSTYTIKGFLVQGCNKTPMSGKNLYLHHTEGSYTQSVYEVGRTITDSTGFFEFTYISNYSGPLAISGVATGYFEYLEDIPKELNIVSL